MIVSSSKVTTLDIELEDNEELDATIAFLIGAEWGDPDAGRINDSQYHQFDMDWHTFDAITRNLYEATDVVEKIILGIRDAEHYMEVDIINIF